MPWLLKNSAAPRDGQEEGRRDGRAPRPVRRKARAKEGYATDLTNKLFDLMAMFAEYGFNKSHTAAWAVVTYSTLHG
ncbi:MAG: hypothetical protein IPM01_15345 [Burkholderiaceae bacterium]|nr:hypothetical protein [Burkholderiaceae bacterium]